MSFLQDEIGQISDVAARAISADAPATAGLIAALRERRTSLVLTVGRGSSAAAATIGRHALAQLAGVTCAPLSLDLATGMTARDDALVIVTSYSGRSPDAVAAARAARDAGALTAALVEDLTSPLAEAVAHVLPLGAGCERSVAATKSFVAAVVAFLRLAADWSGDAALRQALTELPRQLARRDTSIAPVLNDYCDCARSGGLIVAEGAALGVAQEVALKLKELALIPVEAIAAAEFLHGPLALAGPGFPLLAIGEGAALDAAIAAANRAYAAVTRLPSAPSLHPLLDPLLTLPDVYLALEQRARGRGLDPDRPRNLAKVTLT